MNDSQRVTIYHNPACGTSRNTLALIRNAGVEPIVIEYPHAPPDRNTLVALMKRAGMRPRDLLREKGTPEGFTCTCIDTHSLASRRHS